MFVALVVACLLLLWRGDSFGYAVPDAISSHRPQDAAARPAARIYWLDEEGAPLPFESEAQVEDFLLTAEVVARQRIRVGITKPLRVTLEKDGVHADAVFRHFERRYAQARLRDGRRYLDFTDSFRFEVAAYELARLLGMESVPPTVRRRLEDQHGTLQLWVHGARMESERVEQGLSPPDRIDWRRQWQQMMLFDALIGNVDRNAGNLLIDGNWKLWLVDHTRAFYARAPIDVLQEVMLVERSLWRRLQELDEELLREALDDSLSGTRIGRLLERRELVIAHVDRLIEERGDDAVLYDRR